MSTESLHAWIGWFDCDREVEACLDYDAGCESAAVDGAAAEFGCQATSIEDEEVGEHASKDVGANESDFVFANLSSEYAFAVVSVPGIMPHGGHWLSSSERLVASVLEVDSAAKAGSLFDVTLR